MFSAALMKVLELRSRSYDARMDRTSGGRVRALKEAVAREVPAGARVLEIGRGTGELAAVLIERGAASVEGFDLSPKMLEVARERIEREGLEGRLTVRRMGVEDMETFAGGAFDAVVATLVFSELNDDERRYALRQAARVLRPDGRLVIVDEVVPRSRSGRLLQALARAPAVAATYLVTRTATRPIEDLAGEVAAAGLAVEKEERRAGDAIALVVARPAAGRAP